MQKQQFFAPFQSYICSNSIRRYATSVKSNSRQDGDWHIAINFQGTRHVRNQNCHNIRIICSHVNTFKTVVNTGKDVKNYPRVASECEEWDIFIFGKVPLKFISVFLFLITTRFCICTMSFLIIYPSSRDKTHVCFYSFIQNFMRSQEETRYHYQNVTEHQYLFRFQKIPLDSSLLS